MCLQSCRCKVIVARPCDKVFVHAIRLQRETTSSVQRHHQMMHATCQALGPQVRPQEVFGPSWHPPQSVPPSKQRYDWSPKKIAARWRDEQGGPPLTARFIQLTAPTTESERHEHQERAPRAHESTHPMRVRPYKSSPSQ